MNRTKRKKIKLMLRRLTDKNKGLVQNNIEIKPLEENYWIYGLILDDIARMLRQQQHNDNSTVND